MKFKGLWFKPLAFGAIVAVYLLTDTLLVRAQFSYITNNGAITITRYTASAGSVTVPDSINGYPVTAIANYAFQLNSELGSVSIGSDLTSLGTNVFYDCTSLTSITVSSQNASFSSANGVLYNRNGSTLLVYPIFNSRFAIIPAGVTSIAPYAFVNCNFSSITLPNGLTNIGSGAFNGNFSLTGISIPGNVASIGDNPFSVCQLLASISVNPTNQYFSSTNGILYDKTGLKLLVYPENKSGGNYVIPDSVTMVASNAVAICPNLTNITISSNISFIGGGAFYGCINLQGINVDPQNNFYTSSNGVLFDKAVTTLITFPGGIGGSYQIPDSVTSVGIQAFVNCDTLNSVSFPDGVTNIGNSAFTYCLDLDNIIFDRSLVRIGDLAFQDCQRLSSVTFDTNLASIGLGAFNGCYSLTNIAIPDSVTSLGASAFNACSKLTSINIGAGVTTFSNSTFVFCSALTNIVIPATVSNIASAAFQFCTALTNVDFYGIPPTADSTAFLSSSVKTVYYLPNTSGWGSTFAGLPTSVWLPKILNNSKQAPVGIQSNQFDFTVSWASNRPVVIQSTTNLQNSSWSSIATNILTNGIWQFSEPFLSTAPAKFYHVSAQ